MYSSLTKSAAGTIIASTSWALSVSPTSVFHSQVTTTRVCIKTSWSCTSNTGACDTLIKKPFCSSAGCPSVYWKVDRCCALGGLTCAFSAGCLGVRFGSRLDSGSTPAEVGEVVSPGLLEHHPSVALWQVQMRKSGVWLLKQKFHSEWISHQLSMKYRSSKQRLPYKVARIIYCACTHYSGRDRPEKLSLVFTCTPQCLA